MPEVRYIRSPVEPLSPLTVEQQRADDGHRARLNELNLDSDRFSFRSENPS